MERGEGLVLKTTVLFCDERRCANRSTAVTDTPKNQTSFTVAIPDLGTACKVAGECVSHFLLLGLVLSYISVSHSCWHFDSSRSCFCPMSIPWICQISMAFSPLVPRFSCSWMFINSKRNVEANLSLE